MFSHVHIGTQNLALAAEFYDRVLAPLGIVRKFTEVDRGWAGWQQEGIDRPLFLLGRPVNGEMPAPGNGHMVAFMATYRNQVERCYELAIAAGGVGEGSPGLRPEYHPNYFGAYFRDLDGNKVCVCCHAPE
ncbi:MAG: VOC family protein [Pseudomonadota bacterium]